LKTETLAQDSVLFPAKSALLYFESRQYGLRGKSFQGEGFFTAENPPFGATFTYYLKDGIKTKKEKRHEAEKEAEKHGRESPYPTKDELRAESEEEAPAILFTITDASGERVRSITAPVTKGFHRVTWDLRDPAAALPKPRPPESDDDLFFEEPVGPLVVPGTYRVTWAQRVDGVTTPLPGEQEFIVALDTTGPTTLSERRDLIDFQRKLNRLRRAVAGALESANGINARLEQIKRALDHTPGMDPKWKDAVRSLEKRNCDILRHLRGDVALRSRNENTPASVVERVEGIAGEQGFSLAKPTGTHLASYRIAGEELSEDLAKLRTLTDVDLKALEKELDASGAPWTPGRLPEWKVK
jgi:hypothetical protein